MLNGSLSESEKEDVANLLDLNATDEYRVITFYLKSGNNKENFSAEQRKETKIVEKAVLKFLPEEYIFVIQIESYIFTRKIKKKENGNFEESWKNFKKKRKIN